MYKYSIFNLLYNHAILLFQVEKLEGDLSKASKERDEFEKQLRAEKIALDEKTIELESKTKKYEEEKVGES